jgi:hypothetical protein
MKVFLAKLGAILLIGSFAFAGIASATVRVKGYVRKTPTYHYVAPHYRTSPNHTKIDNWSTKGNVNPYTGKAGTKSPFKLK